MARTIGALAGELLHEWCPRGAEAWLERGRHLALRGAVHGLAYPLGIGCGVSWSEYRALLAQEAA